MSSIFNTPLRYPGGKGRLTRHVSKIIELNSLNDGVYIEPYAGGAGIAISLLFSEHVRSVVINDLNKSIYAFWKSILDHNIEFCDRIREVPITVDEWYKQKDVQNDSSASLLNLGFSTFYLNRVNRSGIINGGLIGGVSQAGKWKMDARFNKGNLIARIESIGRYRSRIKVCSMDAADFILSELPGISEKSLVYFDPPYCVKGGGLYENNYCGKDHKIIADLVQSNVSHNWMMTYDNHELVRRLYENRRQEIFNLHYSANKRFTGSELMIYGDSLVIPERVVASRSTAA
ncbi:MAG: DNA adenine methylase [Algiphilus sp.]|uniref:DNA adenine methylase n=1 Tax=Algiphilus sp. TaxID=1872431 RepID=UPI0032EDCD5C